MKLGEKIVLDGVREYCEEYPVELTVSDVVVDYHFPNDRVEKLCVSALNEGGYNGVEIDAEQLYKALKNYFENKEENK